MQEIADWLKTLGMSEYAERFAENDIDFTILGDLTDQDLEKIGVASLGHRRKLLRAIADLKDVGKSEPRVTVVAVAPAGPRPQDNAERRQVTVMFSDLVGSTALSARMDPEDLREVISAYQKCVAETVRRFGGFVAKYMGDGVLVYFGYPQAHEDDAERAVRAGLELIAAVSALKSPVPLQTRVGIATGLVVVGDLVGSGEAQERGIVGETPNLAARLQGIAEPNSVVIAEATRKLLGNLFELEDLGAKDLKGIAGPVRAWAALRASSAQGRFEALHATGLTALVGRDEELELLLRRWSRAKSGEGQVVLLSGEPGIGKSRLTAALLERLAAEPHTRLRYFCSPQHTDGALYPIISQMERAAGMAHDDTAQAKLDKLDAVLAQSFTPRQDAALFAEMLSLPNGGRYPALELAPEQRRQRTMEALIAQTEALTRQSPVLMIFEDTHWIVAETLENQFSEIAESQSELLARHCAEAGLIEKAAGLWGKAGQRSLERSALVEAVEQLTRALGQIAALPATPVLRREEIKLQVALITPLIHVKGYAAPETQAAVERARLLIEQAETLGEPPEDPLLLFSVLYGVWAAHFIAFNGDALRELAVQFLALAEKQRATVPLMIGHRLMGNSLLLTGDIAQGRAHYNQALTYYDPAAHRPLVTRFGQDTRVSVLSYRSVALWMLGYPEAALADVRHALNDAREIGHAATLMYALHFTSGTYIHCGNYAAANLLSNELLALADEKGALFWKATGVLRQGIVLALTGKASDAVQMLTAALTGRRSTGATQAAPLYLSYLAWAYADLGQFEDARRCTAEAMTAVETTRKKCYEAEVNRVTGEIVLKSPEPNAAKAEAYFERALAVARQQQAKSWELRAAMSMARLWRDQGKREQALDLLAPVYGWFTEGFDTLDLKEAKTLLDELVS